MSVAAKNSLAPLLLICLAAIAPGCASTSGLKLLEVGGKNVPGIYSPTKVPTLTPQLRWEAFPRPADLRHLDATPARISNVSYQLRVWRAGQTPGGSVEDVVTIAGLREPQYTISKPLEPKQTYCWTVRVWFDLEGGRRRVSQWSQRAYPRVGPVVEVTDDIAWQFKTP